MSKGNENRKLEQHEKHLEEMRIVNVMCSNFKKLEKC